MEVILSIFTLAGGLGFFLYGMSLMGSGLKKAAGTKLGVVLEKLSSNPIKGVLLGALVTAVLQSSSATTVMVVGFVNSEMMTLSQAIGVIMGANIGTTATGWLLSLAGIGSGSSFLDLLKPSSFAPLLVLIGAAIIMFSKSTMRKHIAHIVLGFGTLMVGMSMMSDAVAPLAETESFIQLMTKFSNPILGIVVGIAITAILQSNSAAVGILQALSLTGTITFGVSIPLIVGMSIGASVPVMLTGIGASTEGKRTSYIYLYFNVIASVLFSVVFYTINAFVPFGFLAKIVNPVDIAIFNTIFKVGAVLILMPFNRLIEKLVCLSVPDKKEETPVSKIAEMLDERFLNSPGVAIDQSRQVVNTMCDLSKSSIVEVIGLLNGSYDEDHDKRLNANEDIVDECEDKLGTYLVKLSSKNLSEKESKEVSKLLHAIGDFERISDHALNILDTAKEIAEKKVVFSQEAQNELGVIAKAITEILDITSYAFKNDDPVVAGQVEPLEQIIDDICDELKNRHVGRLQRGICTIEQGFVFSDLLSNYERISDHCSNIAVSVIRLREELYDTHDYLNKIKKEDAGSFHDYCEQYKAKYFDAL